MYSEDDFIHIGALQHYVFCPRQCALIHVEDAWRENVYTVRGDILHEKAHSDTYETRGTLKTVRGLRIHSYRLGIVGRCDVVEFRAPTKVAFTHEITPTFRSGTLTAHQHAALALRRESNTEILPVEFKAGKPKEDISDKVQLCAQALCLEEMLNTTVKRGAFFYGRIRRRLLVEIDEELRKQTEDIIAAVHDLVSRKRVPTLDELLVRSGLSATKYMEKCGRCSLYDVCQPRAMNERRLGQYVKELYTA
jgi:CRISPR-associated exonuclease Cas4